jgi:uncharacterized repeat protein (TIGR02543 family)
MPSASFEELPQGYGSFSLIVGNASRTILPDASMNSFAAYTLIFTATGGGGGETKTENRTSANYSSQVTLKAGTYNLTVNAYADGDRYRIAATGTLTGISISAGTSASGSVTLSMISDSDSSGTFHYNVNITASGVTSASMEITQGNAPIIGSPVTLHSGVTSGNLNGLASGDYNVRVKLIKGDVNEEAVWNELLHIRAEMTSAFSKTFDNEFFYSTHYNVAFNYNYTGAPTAGTQSVIHGGMLEEPESPSRTGYSFAGWYKDAACTTYNWWNFDAYGDVDADTVTSSAVTLYAKWLIKTYTVTFNSNSGSAVGNIPDVEYGSKITAPADPTRTGYTFAGWYKDAAFTNQWVFNTDTVTSITTLYAKWTYTVTFNANGGSGTVPAAMTANAGNSITLPNGNVLTKTDYTFGGWNISADGTGTNYSAGVSHTLTSVTLYAKWNINTYTVSFESNGGNAVTSITNVAHGSKITAPTPPTKADINFDGWYKESTLQNPWNFTTDTVTAATTLYAKWVIYLVTNETELRYVGKGTANLDPYKGWTLSAHYRQTTNITLEEGNWTPIGTGNGQQYNFNGSYNGAGHTITGLSINADSDWQGMFGFIYSNGKVENLGLVDVNITGTYSAGGIAGTNRGTIQNCYVTGSVTGSANFVGGIAGNNEGGIIQNCYVSGSVTGSERVGGIAGNNSSTLRNCYVSGSVTGSEYVGGIVGYANSGSIRNCVALNQSVTLTGLGSNFGRIQGYYSGTRQNNYAWKSMTLTKGNVTVTPSDATLTGKDGGDITATQAKTAATWTTAGNWDTTNGSAWDFTNVWQWNTNGMPSLRVSEGTSTVLPWPDYLVDPPDNPTTWTAVTNSTFGSSSSINAIAHNGETGSNSRFVAVGDGGNIAYSTDGENWTKVTNSTIGTGYISAIAYGNNRFVALWGNNRSAYSTDGVTWNVAPNTISGFNSVEAKAIAYANGRFVAGNSSGQLAYSAGGITWTTATSTFGGDSIDGIAYGGGKFVAVGNNSKMASSSDGINWTNISNSGFTTYIDGIAYGGGKFVAVGNLGQMTHSTDGSTWTPVTTSTFTTRILGIAHNGLTGSDGRFVAVGYSGRMAYSDNGTSWTSVATSTFSYDQIKAIAYGNGRWVAVGQYGKIAVCIQ